MRSPQTAGIIVALCLTLGVLGCRAAAPVEATRHLVDDHPAFADDGRVNVVVEIPAGTNDKWEVDKTTGQLEWEIVAGQPRVVDYLAYPANYGMVPQTRLPEDLGGDGDPLDVLVLGPAIVRGAIVAVRPIGVLRLTDTGERDDKILAVTDGGPFSGVTDMASLDAMYPGARQIIETWFTSYKGPGVIESGGFEDAETALAIVREASEYYEADRLHGG